MDHIRAYWAKTRSFLARHKAVRIALIAVLVLAALLLVLRPYGTKTFLILGMDNYGSLDEVGRSDVTMLVQIDFTRAKISAVTFARDMFIENENGRLTKINTVVRNKDEDTLCRMIEQNFGVKIDGWFRVNFTSVIYLVDAIGGAEVELTQAEVKYLTRMGYNVYPENPLAEGKCRLNGAQALTYARCRKLDDDLGRGERQGKLISGMVRQTRRMTAANVISVFRSLNGLWRSSCSAGEQAKLVFQALWLRGAKVVNIGMPFSGEWRYGNANSVSGILADLPANKLLLLEALGLPAPETAPAP
ncbi:MAG: LCP family protein [Clostridia bacterium]|nr:LCP family protein [Clostridia bacterium]